jgi:hypothetical protein
MMLPGTRVPEDAANPHAEICHAFVYRWLMGRQLMSPAEKPDPIDGPFNGTVMKPILWPEGGKPVRVAGVNKVNPGDIVGFFDGNGALVHSMVAKTPTQWVGANNQGCFGTGTARTTIDNVYLKMKTHDFPIGWADNIGNRFITMGGECTVVFRTP